MSRRLQFGLGLGLAWALVGSAAPSWAAPAAAPAPDSVGQAGAQIEVLDKPRWIKHRIIPGELLGDIADRYQVSSKELIRWNKLDPDHPRIYAGRKL